MGHAALLNGAAEDGGHVLLCHQVRKALGSVAASEGDGHGVRRLWAEKENASGTPKRPRTSLSAATGEVLTQFTRRCPSDLRHEEYSRVSPRGGPAPNGRRHLPHHGNVVGATHASPLRGNRPGRWGGPWAVGIGGSGVRLRCEHHGDVVGATHASPQQGNRRRGPFMGRGQLSWRCRRSRLARMLLGEAGQGLRGAWRR